MGWALTSAVKSCKVPLVRLYYGVQQCVYPVPLGPGRWRHPQPHSWQSKDAFHLKMAKIISYMYLLGSITFLVLNDFFVGGRGVQHVLPNLPNLVK